MVKRPAIQNSLYFFLLKSLLSLPLVFSLVVIGIIIFEHQQYATYYRPYFFPMKA